MSTPPRPSHQSRLDGIGLIGVMVALMWIIEVADSLDHHALDQYGIKPRELDGLIGIVTAPLLHVSFGHLIANTVPLGFMGLAIALAGAARVVSVTAIVVVVGGLGTWLIAPSHTVIVGASGLVFGYAAYLLARGVFERGLLELAMGVLVLAVWGGALVGSLVPHDGISWQGHLCGAAAGVLAAALLRRERVPRRAEPTTADASLGP
ncbi:MAG TPA: rhomboid family intramembrane serine protease [Solirubrobacteraceae bacterium]